ncbi:histidine phosphatase family protein [Acidocella sp. KAb 2-4]|uniref:histidine phosphatase family protein n=1 Tax=Acidocella sp. KAb 2-4 TaxID=2885158 RepID=UPI001D068903|nr:histidine phosphatase family protein [Acidocella sp. KAb 2-4]MCB5944136.1 phosphoglycerate mutase family protein [Acidocella sp. KAb 2-4]
MFLLRHGQSYFNLHFTETRRDPGIEDPELTPLGHEQARKAAARLRAAGLTRIIVSPYTRALQTAQPFLALPGVTVEVWHEVRERTAFVCDIGSHPEALARRFPAHEFGHLPARWWHDETESEAQTTARADAFRAAMAGREDEATTLLVSHWGFILALTGVSVMNGEMIEYDPRAAAPEQIVWKP